MHDYSAVMQGQQVLDTLNKTVNGADAKPLTVDAVAAAARAGKDWERTFSQHSTA
jgi:hypothetical protein